LCEEYKGDIILDFLDQDILLDRGKSIINKIKEHPNLIEPIFHNLDTKNFIKVKLASEHNLAVINYQNKKYNKRFLKNFYQDFHYLSQILPYCDSKEFQDQIILEQQIMIEEKETIEQLHKNLNDAIDKAQSNATYIRQTSFSKIKNLFTNHNKQETLCLEKK
jgi:hypothetical protein